MPLDRQVNLYSVDTAHFYSRREERLHRKYVTLRKKQKLLREAGKTQAHGEDDGRKQLAALIRYKGKLAARTKERLSRLLKHKADQNLLTGGRDHRRFLNESTLSDKDVISMFESSVTRMLGMEKDTLMDSLIVVQVFYFDVFRDILCHGFTFRAQPYRYFTSSAGQIRKKKAVFMKQALWELHEKTLLCGLTIDRINEKGGNNVNKHLAYMALACSATDEWSDFPLDRSIVVEDFETLVPGTCDFIDDENYSVTRTLQRSVRQYPQLLNDPYMKKILRDIKDSMVRRYRCGKLETEGKYTFLLPDFYAACQYWFGQEKDPCGLLADGEVYCSLFLHREELDCLRSPHLYREHAVRHNLPWDKNQRAQKASRWFCTNAVYTSCHDLISRLLQFDVDGDKALVVAGETLVSIARRNMKDIVPRYYRMRKAPPLLSRPGTGKTGLPPADGRSGYRSGG